MINTRNLTMVVYGNKNEQQACLDINSRFNPCSSGSLLLDITITDTTSRMEGRCEMNCPKCGSKMYLFSTIDDNWKVYKCPKCKEQTMRHKHGGKLSQK